MKIISSKEFIILQTQQIAVNGDQSLLRPMNIGVKTAGPLWVNFTLLVSFLLTILNFSLFFLLAYTIPLWGIEVAREYGVACMIAPVTESMWSWWNLFTVYDSWGIDQSNLTADCITYGVFVCFWKEKYSIWYVYYSMIVIWKSIFYDNGMISDSTQNLFIVEDDLIRSKYFPLDYQNFHSFHTSQLHIQFLFTPKMPTKRSPITPKRKSAEINESSSDEEIKVYTHVWQI